MCLFYSTFADISKAFFVELRKYRTKTRTMHQAAEFSVRHHLYITLVFSPFLEISDLKSLMSAKSPVVWARMHSSASYTDDIQ